MLCKKSTIPLEFTKQFSFSVMMGKLPSLFLLLWYSSCTHLTNAKQFRDYSYSDLSKLVEELDGPFASVQSADKLWGHKDLKSAQCSAQVIRVTAVERLQASPPSSPQFLRSLRPLDHPLPQVVISGEIHGNERVGPSSALFTAQLLVWAGLCAIKKSDTHCSHLKEELHLSNEDVTWLAFLATRRDTFVLPAPNCQGYTRNVRMDEGVDTNRDFSYARKDDKCFISTTAKIFQALFSTVSVQILVTFHGGMVALGYEWGSMDHPRGKDLCPDHVAHKEIGESMARFGGTFKHAKAYRAKPINSIVYPVYGGMEDWAYAAGWDTARVRTDCRGYATLPATQAARSIQNQPVAIPNNRAVTFLVETSDRKGPSGEELGNDQHVLLNEKASNEQYGGHIPRNTRLALAAIDLVEPYVCFSPQSLGNSSHTDRGELIVEWYVGGAHQVDRTWLSWHHSAPSPSSQRGEDGQEGKEGRQASAVLRGQARWALADPMEQGREGQFVAAVLPPSASMLSASTSTRMRASGGVGRERRKRTQVLWLVAHAVVDQKWASSGQGYPRGMGPQSHLVQMRTNSSYEASSYSAFDPDDVRLRGRPGNEWLSDAIEVEVEVAVAEFSSLLSDSGGGGVGRYLRGKGRGKGKRGMRKKQYRSSSSSTSGEEREEGVGEKVEEARLGVKGLHIKSMVEHCAWWTRT